MSQPARKPIFWIASSKKDMKLMPEDVKDVFGSALLDVQYGETPADARPFGEGVSREVMKLAEDFNSDTYRAAYTAVFPECVYVLHVFKKKSKSGIATPKPDKDLIETRLAAARNHYAEHFGEGSALHKAKR